MPLAAGSSNLGRRTRSGTVFSPWEIHANSTYEVPLNVADFLDRAMASEENDDDEFFDPSASLAPALSNETPSLLESRAVSGGAPCDGSTEPPSSEKGANEGVKKRREKQREKRRQGRSEKQALLGTRTKEVARKRIVQARLEEIPRDLRDTRHASTGVFGLRPLEACENKQVLTLAKDGFRVVPWDDPSQSFAFVDNQGRMFVGGASPKDTAGWEGVNVEACKAINHARESCSFTEKQVEHQRGSFPVLASGISYGNGRKRPLNVKNTARNSAAMKKLLEGDALKRIVGLQNQLLHTFSPKTGSLYATTLEELLKAHPELLRNFPHSDFACITVNFGPVTETVDHVDRANLAAGFCAVTALGNFNPKLGGHLVLWDLKLVLEFPPGATILLPSALLRHSNTPLNQPGAQRFSVTQYSPGGLFRWVENGFCSNLECSPELNSRAEGKRRWEEGLARFSKANVRTL